MLSARLPLWLWMRLLLRVLVPLPAALARVLLVLFSFLLFRHRQPHKGSTSDGACRASAHKTRLALKPTTPQQKPSRSVVPYSISVATEEEEDEDDDKEGSPTRPLTSLLLVPLATSAGHRRKRNNVAGKELSVLRSNRELELDKGCKQGDTSKKTFAACSGSKQGSKLPPSMCFQNASIDNKPGL